VAGAVAVNNKGVLANPNYSNVVVLNSNLGNQAAGAANPNPLQVSNGVGYDSFSMTGSTAQWGVSLNNNAVALTAAATYGSSTSISGSSIGTGPDGPNNGLTAATAGQGLTLLGDNGPDVVTVSSTTINGATALTLNGGDNNVTFQQQTTLTSLNVATGVFGGAGTASPGNDVLSINSCNITDDLTLNMGGNSNKVTIHAGTTSGFGQLPNPNYGPITISGNPGVPLSSNTLTIDSALFNSVATIITINNFIPTFT
jgi:hypothetical protein